MKKLLCVAGFLALASQVPLLAHDTSPSMMQVVPEAVWALATGGGTWVTELQAVNVGGTISVIAVVFSHSTGSVGPFNIAMNVGSDKSVRFPNILATLDALDSSEFVYYGRAGSLYVYTTDLGARLQVQARTVNGNYGKTFPGLNPAEGTTAGEGRSMMIQDLVQNATYRTFVGVYNANLSLVAVRLRILDGDGVQVGSIIDKALLPSSTVSFNPFKEAGVPSGTYENCYVIIEMLGEGVSGYGVFCYGSIANNYTNDTYALIAKHHRTEV